jgi:hypothetical protein
VCNDKTKNCFLNQVKPGKIAAVDWEEVMGQLTYDDTVGPVKWAQPGTKAGLRYRVQC